VAELAGARSSWPVRANGLLLVLQAAGLGGIGAYEVYRVDWQQVEADLSLLPETLDLPETVVLPETVEGAEHAVVTVLVFAPPTVLALLAALGFLFLLRAGWLLAMIVQGLSLLACLLLYSAWTPIFIYPVMLYCIVMALYLNSSDVRAAFHVGQRTGLPQVATRGP
jgi:hypothetical protein